MKTNQLVSKDRIKERGHVLWNYLVCGNYDMWAKRGREVIWYFASFQDIPDTVYLLKLLFHISAHVAITEPTLIFSVKTTPQTSTMAIETRNLTTRNTNNNKKYHLSSSKHSHGDDIKKTLCACIGGALLCPHDPSQCYKHTHKKSITFSLTLDKTWKNVVWWLFHLRDKISSVIMANLEKVNNVLMPKTLKTIYYKRQNIKKKVVADLEPAGLWLTDLMTAIYDVWRYRKNNNKKNSSISSQ